MNGLISNVDLKLIEKLSNKIFNDCSSELIDKIEIDEIIETLKDNKTEKLVVVSALETLHYCFSVILSEVRQIKRDILTGIFIQKPKLLEEKSVLEKKLDAEPEYAKYKEKEEYCFQFLEHISNIKNTIVWLVKESE